MIGIVLVSHSRTLAEGVRELATQMAPEVVIAAAGGDDDDGIGTSFDKINAALDTADHGQGAIILYDLGSAQLTAETVVEMLEGDRARRVRLVDAPLVEGALAAATSITPDADVTSVAAAARAAGAAWRDNTQATDAEARRHEASDEGLQAADESRSVTLRNPLGLHARPAGAVVRALAGLEADVHLQAGTSAADARSLLALVGLAATGGQDVTITASGADANAAVDRIVALIEDGFGERGDQVSGAGTAGSPSRARAIDDAGVVVGQRAARGGAVGPAAALVQPEPDLDTGPPKDIEAERARFDTAVAQARAELDNAGEDDAREIFDVHRQLLDDPALVVVARGAIDRETRADKAWWEAVKHQQQILRERGGEVVAARAADVLDIGRRVLRALGVRDAEPTLATSLTDAVVVAEDVTPSQMTRLHAAGVAAVVTAAGSPAAHSSIIARSLGVPMVTGVGSALANVGDGTILLVDADGGRVTVAPDDRIRTRFADRLAAAEERRRRLRAAAHEPVRRADGTPVRIGANVASLADVRAAIENGAEEVGLLRTEFWFTDREDVPSEDEQAETLAGMLEALAGRPAIVRTMDVGGDKRAPALRLDRTRNGFLGQRGIRWCLAHPDVFHPHLRAILRAGAGHRLRIMFPFVTTVQEVRAAKEALRAAAAGLDADGLARGEAEAVGIMLEIPGAALQAAHFTAEVDFVSIGTNDLIQYMTAADRTVPEVAHLATPEHADLLRVVGDIVAATATSSAWVGVCGEIAADPQAAVALLDAGVTELSMAATAIPEVKWHLREQWASPPKPGSLH